ncbi:DNA-binding domain-containing protein [Spirillospora sp. NPDC029432]|uniref:DNA-binding domain-containing protein n=1 Tax=Spirillospora sp. NPDC029432 TaxID=3154599 RepID=UPI0034513598
MPERSELARLQRWMQDAILAPGGPTEAAGSVLTASGTMTAEQRLGVYWRGYRLRLLEGMRGLHEGLCHLLGRETFDAFALAYLEACPPRTPTLFRLDEGFADYLEATRPDAGRPPGEPGSWTQTLIDLARLERLFTEVLDGPGTEGTAVLGPGDLPADPARLARLRLVPAPCLRLLRACFPAHEYLRAVRLGRDPELPAPRAVHLVLSRTDHAVTVSEVDPAAYRALSALVRGATAGDALDEAGAGAEQGLAWLRRWAGQRFFTTVTTDITEGTTR